MTNPANIEIRAFITSDFAHAVRLWSNTEGIGLTESDTLEGVTAFLARNPGFSAVAVTAQGAVVGAVLCGHNGRNGSLHHLTVAASHRRQGVGKRLVDYCFAKLAEANVPRCNIFVYTENAAGNRFWTLNGWNNPTTWKVMQRHVLISPA